MVSKNKINSKELTDKYLKYRHQAIRTLKKHFSDNLTMEDCEDICIEAYRDLYKTLRMRTIELTTSFEAFFYTVCVNKALNRVNRDHFRHAGNVDLVRESSIDMTKVDRILDAQEDCERQECIHAIHQALGKINERCQKIFRKQFWDNLKNREIAIMLEMTGEDAVKSAAYYCRNQFYKKNKHLIEICMR